MAWLSIGFSVAWGVLGLGFRFWLHRRRTGRSPMRRGAGPAGWLALLGVTSTFFAGPVAEVAFGVHRLVHSAGLAAAGAVVGVIALGLMLWSQAAMGSSLRIGVDPNERTALVTEGPFDTARNPIYSAMVVYLIGSAMLVPNAASIVAAVVLAVAVEFQVRHVEEPYLSVAHGEVYRAYGRRVGRFVPGLGRFREL
jgi:protein-S-isoprenylcysteine O-methyltransferase Ste14